MFTFDPCVSMSILVLGVTVWVFVVPDTEARRASPKITQADPDPLSIITRSDCEARPGAAASRDLPSAQLRNEICRIRAVEPLELCAEIAHDPFSDCSQSWEHWKARYEARGYQVLTPAYPGFEVEVEALNADPSPIKDVTVPQIVEHLESVIGELDAPPILMGHSAGGVFVQLLLDRGHGAAGVAINSAPPEGIPVVPLSQIKSTFAVLRSPANRHKAVGFTPEQWHYAFTNTFSEEESRALYERYHVPASGGIFWDNILANVKPGHQDTWVDFNNDSRAPLLFISSSEDHLMPPNRSGSGGRAGRTSDP